MRTTVLRMAMTTLALAVLAAPLSAATWNYVGTATRTVTPAYMQDEKRIIAHDVVIDPDGRVYMTAGPNQTAGGSVVVWTPDNPSNPTSWSRAEIDLSAAGRNLPGGVTKMVVAGDGKVYAAQGWTEIGYPGYPQPAGGPYVPSRILRINSDATVDVIQEYSPVVVYGDLWANRVSGITVGGDGNVYWTITGAMDSYWKRHLFWRYTAVTGAPPIVEESPINGTTANGWGEDRGLLDLEYVGDGRFAVVSTNLAGAYVSSVGWNEGRVTTGLVYNGVNQLSDIKPDWGVTRIMKLAYDPVFRKLWFGPRGNGNTVIMGRWNGNTSNAGLFTDEFLDDPGSGDPDTDADDWRAGIEPGTCLLPTKPQDAWHANGNGDAGLNVAQYWIASLAVNPGDSSAWMSWGARANYAAPGTYGPVGEVYIVDRNGCGPTGAGEGRPQAAHTDPNKAGNPSQVVALAFTGSSSSAKLFAETVDLVTGEASLYWAVNDRGITGACCTTDGCFQRLAGECVGENEYFYGAGTPCDAAHDCTYRVCYDPFADADGDGDVDQLDFAVLQACYTGAGGTLSDWPVKCSCFNRDAPVDQDVDGVDFSAWIPCASGPGIAADETCDGTP